MGRIVFAALPNVKPTSFIKIMTGMVFGAESGYMVGAICAIVSNLFYGQGPWTPWQMFSWGLMGFTAGLLRDKKILKNTWGKVLFGFIWGFIFGWIMDIWAIIGFVSPITWTSVLGAFIASFYFDLVHALSNALLLGVFTKNWMKLLHRIKKKYGLLDTELD